MNSFDSVSFYEPFFMLLKKLQNRLSAGVSQFHFAVTWRRAQSSMDAGHRARAAQRSRKQGKQRALMDVLLPSYIWSISLSVCPVSFFEERQFYANLTLQSYIKLFIYSDKNEKRKLPLSEDIMLLQVLPHVS